MSPLLRANSATSASVISRSKSAVRPTRRAATGRTTASGNSMVVLQSVTLQLVVVQMIVVQVIQDQIKGNEFRQNIVVEFHPELLLDHIGQDIAAKESHAATEEELAEYTSGASMSGNTN